MRRWTALQAAFGQALAFGALTVATTTIAEAQPTVPAGYEIVEFFRFMTVAGGGIADVRVAPGTGPFGSDVFVADPGGFSTVFDGRVWRLRDGNADGDAMDAGESSSTLMRSPAGLDFGFGDDLYILDYPSSTLLRFVYKLTNAAAPVLSQFTTTSIFNPNSLRFHPLGPSGAEQMLITAAQTFTVFGGTNDGRLFKVGPLGGAPVVWATGANINEGVPPGWWDTNFQTGLFEGWVVVRNSAVRYSDGGPVADGSLWAVKDLNNDGDADDIGESRRLAANFANGLWGVTFDAQGVGYVGTGTQILRLEDLNGDHDFYDFVNGVFDDGERTVFVSNLPSALHGVDFGPNGEIYVASTLDAASASPIGVLYLVRPAANRPPEIAVGTDPLVLEGNSTGGFEGAGLSAAVANVSATDPDGDTVTLTNNAPAVLPLGDTTVTWTASDPSGAEDMADQVVRVQDTTGPSILVPGPISQVAASPLGHAVTYAASASDVVDASPSLDCVPASGAMLPLGTTTVNCTALDGTGNQNAASFLVTLTVGQATFDGFVAKIGGMGLEHGLTKALQAKVQAAAGHFAAGDLAEAVGSLNALLNQGNAQEGKKLTTSQAAELRECANALIGALSAP